MEENQDSSIRIIEKLALIAESVQTLFSGKGTIIFELPREVDRQHKQFTIDISGTDFHFILDEKDKL
jgi:hypothetical protein